MLSFFRKYEKTFFLIVFLPAIIGMGVTSVIVTVLTEKPQSFQGKVFGEEISASEWESVIRPYVKFMGRSDEGSDAQFKFFAFYKAAQRAGIRVSDARVAEGIIGQMQFGIAQLKAADRIRNENVDIQTPEGQQKFRGYVFEYISSSRGGFTEDEYARYLSRYGMSVSEFEAYQKREKMREELWNVIRGAATVSPDDLWTALKEKEHKREAEIVTLEATAYVPSQLGTVTDDEVKKYWELHRELYDEPRRVNLEYVAAPFERTRQEVGAPTDEALKAYYERHQDDFKKTATVGTQSVSVVQSFSDVRDKISDLVVTDLAKERAQSLLEQVAAKLDEQRKTPGAKVSLAAARDAVAAANTNTPSLVAGETGLKEADEIATHALLNGFASYRWSTNEPASETRTSDPLRGEKCVSVLRTKEIKERRSPEFDEVKQRVRAEYSGGGDRELKKHYEEFQWKYRTPDRWKFDVVTASYEHFAQKNPNLDPPTADDLAAFWKEQHDKLWPAKDAAAVGSDAIALAWKADKSKDLAQRVVKKVRDEAAGQKDRKADLTNARVAVEKSSFLDDTETKTLDREALEKDAVLKVASTLIPLAEVNAPSDVLDLPDGKGKFFVVVREKAEQKTPDLAEVKDKVRADVLAARGYERAKTAAEKLILELRDLRGDALAAALKAKGLVPWKTGLFGRKETVLAGLGSEANQVVSDAFSSEVDGGYEHSVAEDPTKKVHVIRCLRRQDPEPSEMATHRVALRTELLTKKKEEYVSRTVTKLTLDAKGVAEEHVKWVRERRDGPNGQVSAKVRTLFIPNDRPTTERWLEDAARKRIEQALGELKKDAKWDKVVFDFSEDESTRSRGGELTEVGRGDLVQRFGFEFEAKVFDLPADSQVSVPIKSKEGFHLVKVTKAATVVDARRPGGEGGLRLSFKHLLVKTDARLRGLPDDVSKKARELAEEKVKKARERLDKGEAFSKVASEVGAEDDARAKGEAFTVPYLSQTVRAVLRQPLEPTELDKVQPEEIDAGAAKEWHLMLCARDPGDKEPVFKQGPRGPRIVFECVSGTKDGVLAARRELEAWQKGRLAENRDPSFQELLREWKKIVHRSSASPSAKKEGAFGLVALDPQLRALPEEVLVAASTTAAGKRTDVIAAPAGFYVLEVVSVETKPKDDPAREREIAEDVLRGTDWTE